MGRVHFKKTVTRCQSNNEDFSENVDPLECKRNTRLRQKQNVTLGLDANKEDCRQVLSDKTNSTVKVTKPVRTNILTENNVKLIKNEKSKTSQSSSTCRKSFTFNESTQKSKGCEVGCKINDNILSNGKNKVVPIYKQTKNENNLSCTRKSSLPIDKKLALYEFDATDNAEEPATGVKKKRKKRNYKRKNVHKFGEKYLTINNIKFSSSESINSLTDKPLHKKPCKNISNNKKQETAVKRQSQSMINLNDTTNTCISVASYMSQPLLQTSYTGDNSRVDLSIINENDLSAISQNNEVSNINPNTDVNTQSVISYQNLSNSNNVSTRYKGNKPDTEDIYSSTPCKIKQTPVQNINVNRCSNICSSMSYVEKVTDISSGNEFFGFDNSRNNSKQFDDSRFTNIYSNVRTSKCFVERITDISSDDEFYGFEENKNNVEHFQDDYNFGFNDDESLEMPLISPIKKDGGEKCDISPSTVVNKPELPPILSVGEIVQLLQSELRDEQPSSTIVEEESTLDSPEQTTDIIAFTDDTLVSFTKPARRSYQRRSVPRYSFVEKEQESIEDEDYVVKESKPLPKRKPKPKVKKEVVHWPSITEVTSFIVCFPISRRLFPMSLIPGYTFPTVIEAEAQKLAEILNSKFQEIDKFSLCVE